MRETGVDSVEVSNSEAASSEGDIILRLKRIEGQVRGLQRMVEEGRECGQILTQLLAVRSSLDQVALQVFTGQIENCMNPQMMADPETRRALQNSIKLWAKLV